MKNALLIFLAIILLSSCDKDVRILPASPSNNSIIPSQVIDTIPDGANLKIRLWTDTTNYDETEFIFRKAASTCYIPDQDARYMPGYGKVCLASLSSDAQLLAISTLPFHTGLEAPLNIGSKTAGTATLGLRSPSKLPPNFHVWLRDRYLRDSTDISAANYNFSITADSNSFGSKRFIIVFKLDNGLNKALTH